MTTNPFEFVKSKTLNLEFIVFLPEYKPHELINKDSSSNYMYMKLKKKMTKREKCVRSQLFGLKRRFQNCTKITRKLKASGN